MVLIYDILIRELVDNICNYLDLDTILNFHLATKYPMSYKWNYLLNNKRSICGICGSNKQVNYCYCCKLLRCSDCTYNCDCTFKRLQYIPFKGEKIRYCALCRILAKIWFCNYCGVIYCHDCVDSNIKTNSIGNNFRNCHYCNIEMIKYDTSSIDDIEPINIVPINIDHK